MIKIVTWILIVACAATVGFVVKVMAKDSKKNKK